MGAYNFANIVVIDDDQIGVIVKCWGDDNYEVYVRSYNHIRTYKTKDIEHFVFSNHLHKDEYEFYN